MRCFNGFCIACCECVRKSFHSISVASALLFSCGHWARWPPIPSRAEDVLFDVHYHGNIYSDSPAPRLCCDSVGAQIRITTSSTSASSTRMGKHQEKTWLRFRILGFVWNERCGNVKIKVWTFTENWPYNPQNYGKCIGQLGTSTKLHDNLRLIYKVKEAVFSFSVHRSPSNFRSWYRRPSTLILLDFCCHQVVRSNSKLNEDMFIGLNLRWRKIQKSKNLHQSTLSFGVARCPRTQATLATFVRE